MDFPAVNADAPTAAVFLLSMAKCVSIRRGPRKNSFVFYKRRTILSSVTIASITENPEAPDRITSADMQKQGNASAGNESSPDRTGISSRQAQFHYFISPPQPCVRQFYKPKLCFQPRQMATRKASCAFWPYTFAMAENCKR